MKFDRFQPGIPLTLMTALAFVVLVGLGSWQAQKIGPKAALLERIENGMDAEPVPLPVHLDDPLSVEYRSFVFGGTVMSDQPIRVFGTNLKGRPGYSLYLPVKHQFGRIVFVNFGWIPMEMKSLPELPSGDVTVTGVLRTTAEAGSFTPPNSADGQEWYTANVFDMGAFYGFDAKEFYHFRLFAHHRGVPDSLPLGGQVRVSIPNNHLEYTLTWYGIAAALLGVYIAYGLSRGAEKKVSIEPIT